MAISKNTTVKQSSMLATIFLIVAMSFSLIYADAVSAGSGDDRAKAVAVHDGFVYVAGFDPDGWRMEKRDVEDGDLDTLPSDYPNPVTNDSWGEPYAMEVIGGYLFVVGDDYHSAGNYQWRIEKRDLDTLALVEYVLINPSDNRDTAYDIASDNTSIFVVGADRSHGLSDAQWRIEKLSHNLERESTVVSNPSGEDDVPLTVATDGGYLYVAGYDSTPEVVEYTGKGKKKTVTSNEQWRIEKRSTSELSNVMETLTENPTDNFDTVKDIAIHDGFIYLVGSQEEGFFNTEWRIEKRYLNDPDGASELDAFELVEEFGTSGIIVENFDYDDQPEAIAIDDSYMYIAGYVAPIGGGGDTEWHIEKRSLLDGDLCNYVTHDKNFHNNDRAYAIAIDVDYIYVAGYYNPGLPEWCIEKRSKSGLAFKWMWPETEPTADFTYSVDGGTVNFFDESSDPDGSIASWAWAFEDGGTSMEQNPSYTYAASQTYPVTLTVTDDDGVTNSITKDVAVSIGGGEFTLTATGYKDKGLQKADLEWSGATSTNVDVYRDGVIQYTTPNNGFYTDAIDQRGGGSYTYQVCEAGTSICSNEAMVTF